MMKGILSVVMACCALVASAGVETALKQARSVHLFYSPLADKAMEARGTVKTGFCMLQGQSLPRQSSG